MKLAIQQRKASSKGETNKLRREGSIPAVLYGQTPTGIPVHVKLDEMNAILRNMQPGLLSTTVFELQEGANKYKAIIKDIQYHVATYAIVHIDFLLLTEDKPVAVNVPIQISGLADCAGIKLGGFLRQVKRSMQVSCLPKDIPQCFTVDVTNLGIAQSVKLADISIPASVKPLVKLEDVALIIGKKAGSK